ncbi:DUF1501 domain-containing protein [Caldimonas brevitalea]|uniref:DUF1501 domain-containing protein n=1 Tax=Caldimonas brevitalea TaxID=413882 RepID=A0A0G3BQT5_9BURK|nr:DUF1501 domain-containing protein [Caldimonas brevitalea]AKJ31764.1 hypothetical protein AAW51_5073 [Caldimonas brevitalea]
MHHHDSSRRQFLRRASALSLAGSAASPFALNLATLGAAAAQTAPGDYKALVCIFLFGGNDTYNTVLATDAASWENYNKVRQGSGDAIALRAPGTSPVPGAAVMSPDRLGGVLALTPATVQTGRSFALHPLLGSAQALFNTHQRLAVVANVGPLLRPTSKAQYAASNHPKPAKLFSHNDQQSTWQALAPEGATAGWGGRMADLLHAGNGSQSLFTSISANGNNVWLAGREVMQYQVGGNGAIRLAVDSNRRLFDSAVAGAALERIVTTSRSGHLLEQAYVDTTRRSIEAERALGAALGAGVVAPYGTPGMNGQNDPLLQYDNPATGAKAANPLAQQLQIVARMIGAAGNLGLRRQVFFVGLGGFDTHDFQNRNHGDLMARLSHGLAYFDSVLAGIGMQDKVTTFTASDFGRTFTSNGDGTDHGWGAHHFVMGGAVRGGDVYGRFPVYGLSNGRNDFTSDNQVGNNGALLPEISVDQYAATMGRWFGLSDGQLLDIFPNLTQFDASRRNLGFMLA